MVPRNSPAWNLAGFLESLDGWADREQPPQELVLIVMHWVLSRYDDPYQGVQREPGFPNLWFGPVPETHHGPGRVVVCSYWIEETTRTVRCDSFATLNTPL